MALENCSNKITKPTINKICLKITAVTGSSNCLQANHVPELYSAKEISEEWCQKHLYCAVPVYYPCSTMLR
jgi:hypothetical protein